MSQRTFYFDTDCPVCEGDITLAYEYDPDFGTGECYASHQACNCIFDQQWCQEELDRYLDGKVAARMRREDLY